MPPSRTVTPEHQVDPMSGAELIGAEMPEWSDLADSRNPTGSAALVADLWRAVTPARTLLIGAVASTFVSDLPEEARVDAVMRGTLDVRAISELTAMRSSLRLYCGSVERFHTGRPYDLVVVLGRAGDLIGPDGTAMAEHDFVAHVIEHVAPGGLLVLGTPNPLGLDATLCAESDDHADYRWSAMTPGFDTRPLHRRQLHEAVQATGLTVERTYTVFPALVRADLLIDVPACPPLGRGTARILGRSLTHHLRDTVALRDPAETCRLVVDAGLVEELAPGWLLIARRDGGDHLPLPAAYRTESHLPGRWGRVVRLGDDATAVTTWASGATEPEVSEQGLRRDLTQEQIPDGDSLDELLRDACSRRSHDDVRALVRSYSAWLASTSRGCADDQLAFTIPRNVVARDEGWNVVDDSWHLTAGLSARDAFILGLHDFASGLLGSGAAHPWRTRMSPDALTRTLAVMAGVTVSDADIQRVAQTGVVIATALDPSVDVEVALETALDRGTSTHHVPEATAVGFRELLASERTLAREMDIVDAKIGWLEGTLRLRDRRIKQYDRLMDKLEESFGYKVLWTLGTPRRAAVRKARSQVEDALPPELRERVISVARRLARGSQQDAVETDGGAPPSRT
ncbi:MAG: hypothetical protein ACRCSN_01985 [Dermatophilaceae bacterium]